MAVESLLSEDDLRQDLRGLIFGMEPFCWMVLKSSSLVEAEPKNSVSGGGEGSELVRYVSVFFAFILVGYRKTN